MGGWRVVVKVTVELGSVRNRTVMSIPSFHPQRPGNNSESQPGWVQGNNDGKDCGKTMTSVLFLKLEPIMGARVQKNAVC